MSEKSTVVLRVSGELKGRWLRQSAKVGSLQDWLLARTAAGAALDSIQVVATGEQLQAWRQRHGFTYEHAAQSLGLKRTALYMHLASHDPLPKRLQLACYAVDVQAIAAAHLMPKEPV